MTIAYAKYELIHYDVWCEHCDETTTHYIKPKLFDKFICPNCDKESEITIINEKWRYE